MQTVTIAQAKNQLSSLIHAVESGEEVVLTRHGKPVARLVAEQAVPLPVAEREAQALLVLEAARNRLRGKISFSEWKSLRDEGRRY
ncbi:MAG: type II toxin-antitoxin system prevent-host-death family antitoxin [Betaproteobacteria bacterium]